MPVFSFYHLNMELNDLTIIICLRKSEVSVERILVCYVNEKLMGHGIHICHAPIPMTSLICYRSK